MNYLSLFSGIGGFEKGIENSKYNEELKCIGFSEVDKYATSIYKRHFPEHKELGDVTKIRTEDLPEFELLVGGFPCQAFSIAGKRRGFNDTRGTLFFEIVRILRDKRPRYFLLENVKGLLSNDKGQTFKTILKVLSDLGYDVKWEVLNSKNFVPQNRERIYIKGYLRGECGGEVLSLSGTSGEADTKISAIVSPTRNGKLVSVNGINGTLTAGGKDSGYNTFINELECSSQLTDDEVFLEKNTSRNSQGGRIYSSKRDSSVTLNCSGNNGFYIVDDKPVNDDFVEWFDEGKNFRTLTEDRAITTTDRHGVYDGYRVRRLTPVECERLQGFPDFWTSVGVNDEVISNTQRYKCLGNAVTTNVITHIFNNWDLKL